MTHTRTDGDPPAKATFRTTAATNQAVRAVVGKAVAERAGRGVTANQAIAAAIALTARHWPEYLELLEA